MASPSHAAARPNEAAQVAKLALLGIGTLATGAVGLFSLAAGYKMKKSRAPETTIASYLDDLTHLVPPWQETSTSTATAAAPADAKPATAAARTVLTPEQRVEELKWLEGLDDEEAAALTFVFDAAAFAQAKTESSAFPLEAKLLARVCEFLPYESVAVLAGVSHGFQAFSTTLLANTGFVYQQARSHAGFNESLRGEIWMRISGAHTLAKSMSQKASASAVDTFYSYLVHQTQGYHRLLIEEHGLSNREPLAPSDAAAAADAAAAVDLSDLTEEARTSLDTILKDVPRTLVPANSASHSLISNPSSAAHDEDAAADGSVSSTARGRQELIASLTNVLSVYCVHDNELGYCQGLNFVAVWLLQKLPEEQAYWLFYKVMQDSKWNMRRLYTSDLHGLLVCKYQFQRLFELYLPELAAHFAAQDIHSDMLTEWWMTAFTFPAFPRRTQLLERVWDLLLSAGGLKFLFRTALAILHMAQATLLSLEFEDIIFFLKSWPDDGITEPRSVLPLMCERFRVSNRALRELEAEFEVKYRQEQAQQEAERAARQQARDEAQAGRDAAASASTSASAAPAHAS